VTEKDWALVFMTDKPPARSTPQWFTWMESEIANLKRAIAAGSEQAAKEGDANAPLKYADYRVTRIALAQEPSLVERIAALAVLVQNSQGLTKKELVARLEEFIRDLQAG